MLYTSVISKSLPVLTFLWRSMSLDWPHPRMYISHQHFKSSRSRLNSASPSLQVCDYSCTRFHLSNIHRNCSPRPPAPFIPSIILSPNKYLLWTYYVLQHCHSTRYIHSLTKLNHFYLENLFSHLNSLLRFIDNLLLEPWQQSTIC